MIKFKRIIRIYLCIVLFLIILFSAYQLIGINSDYRKSDLLYDNTKSTFSKVIFKKSNVADNISDNVTSYVAGIKVDFEELQKINSDVVGWIYFENEDISYPVLYSGDDYKYLRTSYTGEHMTAGSIFVSGSNNPDFMDMHTIIYGHNMKDLSMFGKLKYYRQKKSYYDKHKYFQIITPDASYRYEIFSCKVVEPDSEEYRTRFSDDDDFKKFIHDSLTSDLLSTDIEFPDECKIISLSTCSGKDMRLLVSAVQIE